MKETTRTPPTHCSARRTRMLRRASLVGAFLTMSSTAGFLPREAQRQPRHTFSSPGGSLWGRHVSFQNNNRPEASTSTSLPVWWFGGTEATEPIDQNADSCELVPIRIERPSAQSRKIFGEIVAPVPLEDVWKILTDYDRLAVHVPNLKESRVVSRGAQGEPGDGQYQCRLYQNGAQKIVGFEFGATVTMDMKERIVSETQRVIQFKCADSFFFQEFDGEWTVQERSVDDDSGNVETLLSYVVVVRPKGPVPVAALEWRIREDVPTNLRAVKRASASAHVQNGQVVPAPLARVRSAVNGARKRSKSMLLKSMNVKWYEDETMAAYLPE